MSDSSLSLHYKVLKQFLEISDDLTAKSKPTSLSRAVRAREKLLKLSGAQFKELSTDVYDELRRRIDESRGEPDFLLPKSSFHPKRNQARQKLSSLPQSRFKDLVLDISFEIERRNLHIPPADSKPSSATRKLSSFSHNGDARDISAASNSSSYHKSTGYPDETGSRHDRSMSFDKSVDPSRQTLGDFHPSHQRNQLAAYLNHQRQQLTSLHVSGVKPSPPQQVALLFSKMFEKELPNPHEAPIGVQLKTVIPSKANLTWSSDEDDDDDASFDQAAERNAVLGNGEFRSEEKDKSTDLNKSLLTKSNVSDRINNKSLAPARNSEHDDLKVASIGGGVMGVGALATSAAQAAQTKELNETKARLDEAERNKNQLEQKYNLLQDDYEFSVSQNKQLSRELEELQDQKTQLMTERGEFDRRVTEMERTMVPSKDYDALKATVSALRLENQSLKNSNATAERGNHQRSISRDLSNNNSPKKSAVSLPFEESNPVNSEIGHSSASLNNNIEKFIEQLSLVEGPSTKLLPKMESLKQQVLLWQGKYEKLKSGRDIDSSKPKIATSEELSAFVAPNGLVSYEAASAIMTSVETVLDLLSNDYAKDLDVDLLFDKVSKISVLSNAVAAQGDNLGLNSNENSVLIREAAVFALTSTRYYAVYNKILPKVIVERSLCEVAFCVCDLISNVKLSTGKGDSLRPVSTESRNKISTGVRPLKIGSRLRTNNLGLSSSAQSSPIESFSKERALNKDTETVSTTAKDPTTPTSQSINNSLNLQGSPTDYKSKALPKLTQSPEFAAEKKTPPKNVSTGVANLASRFSSPEEAVLKNVSPNRYTPSKGNILDKVKQFESPTEVKPFNASKSPLNGKLSSREEVENTSSSSIKSSGSIKRSKSFFQSIRDKLTTSSEDKKDSPVENSKEVESSIHSSPIVNVPNVSVSSPPIGRDLGFNDPDATPKLSNNADFGSELTADLNLRSLKDETTTSTFKVGSRPDMLNGALAGAAIGTAGVLGATEVESKNKTSGFMQKLNNKVGDFNHDEGSVDSVDEQFSPNKSINDSSPSRLSKTQRTALDNIHGRNMSSESKASFHSTFTSNNDNEEVQTASVPTKNVKYLSNVQTYEIARDEEDEEEEEDQKTEEEYENGKDDGENEEEDVEDEDDDEDEDEDEDEDDEEDEEEYEARQRQEYRKSMAAATFNVDLFDIEDPDNTLTQVLLYLEHQTVEVIATIQSLLSAIKKPDSTRNDLCEKAKAITVVISQMTEATNTSMNQTRNAQLKEHGSWVVRSLEDCNHRMNILCKPSSEKPQTSFADKNFKQRLAGISFDIAKCTKELVKSVEEASLKEDIAHLDARLAHPDDLT